MSAAYLRETAEQIRDMDNSDFELAVADWLASVADNYDIAQHGSWSGNALAVARAWRGGA